MIIDVEKFILEEQAYWRELESMLNAIESEPGAMADLEKLRRFHYLYQRASADLAKISTFSSEQKISQYLESLVSRSYGEIHETRRKKSKVNVWKWLIHDFPDTFRRRIKMFKLSCLVMTLGVMLGGFAITNDPAAKEVLMPYSHLQQSPEERVRKEEAAKTDRMEGAKATFSSYLMTHNTRVSILTLALGISWGVGSVLILFINGVLLGAVTLDYIMTGQVKFLIGWLLPHGAVEIPAILIAGQAGLLLGSAMIGWGESIPLRRRLRLVGHDLITLGLGIAVMLIWAGLVESFFSQYHEPVISYEAKIAFGVVELLLLIVFLNVPRGKVKEQESDDE